MKRDDITFYSVYRETCDTDADVLGERIELIKCIRAKRDARSLEEAAEFMLRKAEMDNDEDERALALRQIEEARAAYVRAQRNYVRINRSVNRISRTMRDGYRHECLHLSCEDCLRYEDCKFYRVPAGTVVLEGAKCGCIHYTSDGIHYPNERMMTQD